MARTTAPLMSLDASGTVATTLVFSKWKGRNYVRRHAIPSNPKTALQTAVRAVFKFLTQEWGNLTAAQKAEWDAIGAETATTGLNAQLSASVPIARQGYGWPITPTQAATSTPSAPTTNALTAGVRQLTFSWSAGTTAPGYGWLIYGTTGTTFTPSFDNLLAVVPAATTSWIWTDLIPGTDYVMNVKGLGLDGDLGSAGTQRTAKPTA